MYKILTIVGARPQFIKAAAVSRAILDEFSTVLNEVIVHTGQHYDENMSQVFFDELEIPRPAVNLAVKASSHGAMTGRMLEQIEELILSEQPDAILIYGDTNSTLAGALAASKLHVPVFHVEAGLRSFNMKMPEEVNRILSDRVSSLLFCPTDSAAENLSAEGINQGVSVVGDVMFDVALFYQDLAKEKSRLIGELDLSGTKYVLATCHRAENTDSFERLSEILRGLAAIAEQYPVVLPLHPRTKKLIENYELSNLLAKIVLLDPLPYLDMIALEQGATAIVTDSGGVQKEAFFCGVPCITMRDETEWIETVALGANTLTGADAGKILSAFESSQSSESSRWAAKPYGDGQASKAIAQHMINFLNSKEGS
ncbi:non-hydrolyzing UDP-N-acetylglucosamine 2-epimerase [Marinobacterium sp. xm-d-530]|uniref:non-hydrolyzing UDP-N-acetylglucosamine 2-epimerase n=1 Tax=Marinobacterium sp. xm-d-530 TaxID=2497747 RepID=UPI0015693465|nr:UDP-N-acetylglucosamine 2-epimerase (non-hydrolyzing) [Marinobacterium sp. xm-d-530]NRQ01192.1 UDP-2,3-diacetamido-2,3-dideoxy-D-glucuronate 2-epimerase [Marinobacterium sp. xm-d-530]